ncbi:MAG TPA: FkbM family methyltransferase [Thermodesulfobacteriota bacterium]
MRELRVTRPCRHGDMTFLLMDDPIGRSLDLYGEWAEAEIDLLVRLLDPGDVALDVGANIGTHTLAFARRVGTGGRVLAFEPQPHVFALLEANVAANRLEQVRCLHAGVSDAAGEMLVPDLPPGERFNSGAVALRPVETAAEPGGVRVPVVTLDEQVGDRCALVKLDVEGMEPRVLAGARRVLSTLRPALYVECNTLEPAWAVVQLTRALGYEAHLHRAPAYNPGNFRGQRHNVFGDAEESSLLLLPVERAPMLVARLGDVPGLTPVRTLDELARALLETRRWTPTGVVTPPVGLLEGTFRELRARLAERDRQVAALEDALATRERHIEALLASASWRVTRPLRAAKAFAQARVAAAREAVSWLAERLPDGTPGRGRLASLGARGTDADPNEEIGGPGGMRLAEVAALPKAPRPDVPPDAVFEALAERRRADGGRGGTPLVDVVVPVYRGIAETLTCLRTVLEARVDTPHEVVVIDDASPEPALSAALDRLARLGLVRLLRHPRNLGFVRTANEGFRLHADRDVVLLNSDTEVYGNWLDRLRAAAYSRPDVGTVTPLSNAAEVFSYPIRSRVNDMRLEVGYPELDALAARANAGVAVEVPTAVGFCMYVRRDCLEATGPFDETRFGRGYGEENDFCLRASSRGWVHLLAGDVFVRHHGSVSFGAEKARLTRAGLRTLLRSFPDYTDRIRDFLARDPVAPVRRRLDLARLRARAGRRAVLFVSHRRGGGTERHIRDLAARLAAEGVSVFCLRPVPGRPKLVRLEHADVPLTPNLPAFDLDTGLDDLGAALAEIGIERVHVHSLVDFDPVAADRLRALCGRLGLPYDATIHDYACICPRINLLGRDGAYCGEPPAEACQACVDEAGSPFGRVSIEAWRERSAELLAGARQVFVPSRDVATRLARHFPGLRPAVRPHPEPTIEPIPGAAARREAGRPLRVAVIGAIGPHKGSRVLAACARDALARRLPIEFVVFGYTDDPETFARLANVTVTGPYDEATLPLRLAERPCHLAFFTSIWPETYSYTLSIAFRAGLFPVAFDLGAIAERIGEVGWGEVLDRAWIDDPARVNDRLLALPLAGPPPRPPLPAGAALYPVLTRDYYGW